MEEDPTVRAALQHIATGGDLANFSATQSEKRAVIAAAGRRRLISWDKARGRYGLTWRGRRASQPRPVVSRAWFSAQALVITVAAVALGLSLSVGVSGLLVGKQMRPALLPSTMPVPTTAAMDIWPEPGRAGGPTDKVEKRDEAEGTSTEPAVETTGLLKPVPPEVKAAAPQVEPRLAGHAKRKVAKTHRKRLHASRRRHARRFHQPQSWSFFRLSRHHARLFP
jgi:hypothetical protein